MRNWEGRFGGPVRTRPTNEAQSRPVAEAPVLSNNALALDLGEAAQMIGVHKRTVLREIRRGRLRGLKIGSRWRVRVAELKAYVERMEKG